MRSRTQRMVGGAGMRDLPLLPLLMEICSQPPPAGPQTASWGFCSHPVPTVPRPGCSVPSSWTPPPPTGVAGGSGPAHSPSPCLATRPRDRTPRPAPRDAPSPLLLGGPSPPGADWKPAEPTVPEGWPSAPWAPRVSPLILCPWEVWGLGRPPPPVPRHRSFLS